MDISEIRLTNFQALCQDVKRRHGDKSHGVLTRISESTGVSVGHLSEVSRGRKQIGSVMARQLEAGYGLERGWMDNPSPQPLPAPATPEQEFLQVAAKLFRRSPVEAQAALIRLMADRLDAIEQPGARTPAGCAVDRA